MTTQSVMCTYDGDTFTGHFGVMGEGDNERVSVEFNGRTVSSPVEGLRPELIARSLLNELVRAHVLEPVRRERLHGRSH